MHPGSFEKAAVMVTGLQFFTIFIQQNDIFGFFGKIKHIFTQFYHP